MSHDVGITKIDTTYNVLLLVVRTVNEPWVCILTPLGTSGALFTNERSFLSLRLNLPPKLSLLLVKKVSKETSLVQL